MKVKTISLCILLEDQFICIERFFRKSPGNLQQLFIVQIMKQMDLSEKYRAFGGIHLILF